MKYVYMLQSESCPDRHYVGSTFNLEKRLKDHNSGNSPHTKKYLPWKVKGFIGFPDHEKADDFEKYLKTASGRAFSKKHF